MEQVRPQHFWRRHSAILFILLVGAGIRLAGIGDYSVDWDEANVLALARLPVEELVRVLAVRDIHPPAFHLLLHGWMLLFGESDWAVRILAGLIGLLGVWASYLLAVEITDSRRVGWITAALAVMSPFLYHYAHLVTHHGFFFTIVLFSWYFLLRLLEELPAKGRFPASGWFWAYGLSSLLMLYSQSFAPLVLVAHALYVLKYRWSVVRQRWPLFLGVGLVFLTVYLPWLWLISQPWHASRLPEMHQNHAVAELMTLVLAPANLFWLGQSGFLLYSQVTLDQLILALGATGLMLAALFRLRQECSPVLPLIACIGFLPLVLVFLATHAFGMPLFQFRALLFAVFAVNLLLAVWLEGLQRWRFYLLGLLLAVQTAVTVGTIFPLLPGNEYKNLVEQARPLMNPDDGIAIYQGYQHIGLKRYLEPEHQGLTERERHMDPRRENLFHMVQGIDNRYFMVSGEDTLMRPDVRQAFQAFQRQHKRVWLFGTPLGIEQLFDCGTTILLLGPGNRYWEIRCPFSHPRHCESPLTGPDADTWKCVGSSPPEASERGS